MYPLWEYFHSKNPFHVLFKGIQELFQKPKTRFHYKNFFINCFWNPGVSGQFPAQEHFQELWNSWWISTARTFWWTQELFSGTQELCFFAKQIIWVHFHRKKRFMNLTRHRGTWRDAEEPDETPRDLTRRRGTYASVSDVVVRLHSNVTPCIFISTCFGRIRRRVSYITCLICLRKFHHVAAD